MGRVVFTQSAQTDLLEAWLFIAEENQDAADRTLDSVESQAKTLSSQPRMGRARPDLADSGVFYLPELPALPEAWRPLRLPWGGWTRTR